MGVFRNSLKFFLCIYSLVAVFSLLICLEDVDHFTLVCPRLGHHIKLYLQEIFKPFRPQILEALLNQLMQIRHRYLSILIFSGIIVIIYQIIFLLYQIYTSFSIKGQKILRIIIKLLAFISFLLWLVVYMCGIGINKFLEISTQLYNDPLSYPQYVESFGTFVQQKYEEIGQFVDQS